MTRISRGVAQRYAAGSASRRKRRRLSRPNFGRPVVADTNGTATIAPPLELPETPQPRVTTRASARARAASRRPFSEYAAEYAYVLTDLRRIGLVAGSLFLGLIVLSFFIR